MSSIYLSTQCSPVENARRIAEHNAQNTEKLASMHQELLNIPLDEIRIGCTAAVVGIVAFGVLFGCTVSWTVGGMFMLAASMVPTALASVTIADYNFRFKRFTAEREGDFKFICQQMTNLFKEAFKQRCKELPQKWNNGEVIDLGNMPVYEAEKRIDSDLKELALAGSFTYKYNNLNLQVPYSDLRRYAKTIAETLPRGEQNSIKRVFNPPNDIELLQEVCGIFKEFEKHIDYDSTHDNVLKARTYTFIKESDESVEQVETFFTFIKEASISI